MATHKPLLHDGRASSWTPATAPSTFVPKQPVHCDQPWMHHVAASPMIPVVTKPVPQIVEYTEANPPPMGASAFDAYFRIALAHVKKALGDNARLSLFVLGGKCWYSVRWDGRAWCFPPRDSVDAAQKELLAYATKNAPYVPPPRTDDVLFTAECPPPFEMGFSGIFASMRDAVVAALDGSGSLTMQVQPTGMFRFGIWRTKTPWDGTWTHHHDDACKELLAFLATKAPTKLDAATPAIVDRMHEFATTCASVTSAEVAAAKESNVSYHEHTTEDSITNENDRVWFCEYRNSAVGILGDTATIAVRRHHDDTVQCVVRWCGSEFTTGSSRSREDVYIDLRANCRIRREASDADRDAHTKTTTPTQGVGTMITYPTTYQKESPMPAPESKTAAALKTLEVDATEAAWRLAGSQFVKLTKEPIVALLSRHLGPDDASLRAKIAAFLDTELGTALLSGMLSVGLSAMPLPANNVSQQLSRELRVKSMSLAADSIADVLMGPLRHVAVMYLQGVPDAPRDPSALPAGNLLVDALKSTADEAVVNNAGR